MIISQEKFKQYEESWIAMNSKTEEVLASGKSVIDVEKKLKKGGSSGKRQIVYKYIGSFSKYIAPISQI